MSSSLAVEDPYIAPPVSGTQYDPQRGLNRTSLVDRERVRSLKTFLASGENYTGRYGTYKQNFWEDLRTTGVYLECWHIDEIIYGLRKRLDQAPHTIPNSSQVVVLDTLFEQHIVYMYKQLQERLKAGLSLDIESDYLFMFDYVKGALPDKYPKPWSDARYVYFPVNLGRKANALFGTGEHWILCRMDLVNFEYVIFDSTVAYTTDDILEQMYILKWNAVIPLLLIKYGAFNDNMVERLTNELWTWRRKESCLQNKRLVKAANPLDAIPPEELQFMEKPPENIENILEIYEAGDCGIFAMKFLEFDICGIDVQNMKQERVHLYREKYATDIYSDWLV